MNKSSQSDKAVDTLTTDVFLSHSWAHKEFARALKDALEGEGLSVWFDEKRIKEADNMPAEINGGIERSRIFLFVLSPESLRSRWCQDEVDWAAKCNKRIITVLHRSVQFDDNNQAHQVLRKPRWIDYQSIRLGSGQFKEKLEYLISRITENQDYLEKHRQFLIRALDWERNGSGSHRLLPGGLVVEAEEWLQEWDKEATAKRSANDSSDAPIPLHRNFIAESRKHERKCQRIRNAAIAVGFVAVSIAAIVAIWQWRETDHRRKNSEVVARSLSIEKQFQSGSQLEALVEVIKLAKDLKQINGDLDSESLERSKLTAWEVIHRINQHQIIKAGDASQIILQTRINRDNNLMAIVAQNASFGSFERPVIKEWNSEGKLVNQFSVEQQPYTRAAVAITSDGERIIVGGKDGRLDIYNRQGRKLESLKAHQAAIK